MKKLVNFVKEAYAEFQKIQWPNKKQTLRLTTYVIGVSLCVGIIVLGLDYSFKKALGLLLTR